MRILSTLILTGMMAAGSLASAATTPAPAATATPATAHLVQKDKAANACRKQADAKHLAGLERDNFIKDCVSAPTTHNKSPEKK